MTTRTEAFTRAAELIKQAADLLEEHGSSSAGDEEVALAAANLLIDVTDLIDNPDAELSS
jgi:hypothetical protein